jgi:hypothetical protein
MIINLKKIGISGFDKEIDIDQVKKRLDELDDLDELNIVYRYESEFGKFLKYFPKITTPPYAQKRSTISSSSSINSIEILLDYTDKKIKSLENTESNKKLDDYDKGANQESLDQKGQDNEKIQSNFFEYYVSEYSFDQKYFDEFKVRLKRHFEYEMRHYYELEIPENSLSDDKYKIFKNKANEIDFQEFEDMRERSKEVKK